MIKIRKNTLLMTLTLIASLLLMIGVFKGDDDVNYYQSTYDTRVGGPFELTNSVSRYVLVEAFVKNKSVFFTPGQAKISAPDISYHNGKYFSIFTPGVSIISIPLYLVGKSLHYEQSVTFTLNILVQLINIVLITKLARKFGLSLKTGIFSAILFIFGTNALTYALTFTQHTLTTMFTLLAVLNSSEKKRSAKNNILLGITYGVAGLVDIPNFFIILPSVLYATYNSLNQNITKFAVKKYMYVLLIGIGFLPFILGFALYNRAQTGSYINTGQFLGRSDYPAPEKTHNKSIKQSANAPIKKHSPLYTRDQMKNIYLMTISNERGIFYYSPILIVAVIGLFLVYRTRKHDSLVSLVVSTCLITLVLYSMHGDPWGGWAFSSRYMIVPSALIFSTLGFALVKFKDNIFFHIIFIALTLYSIFVSLLGALTTNAIPPKVEAVNLPNPIPYTYEYNIQLIKQWNSSLVYNNWFDKIMSPQQYYYLIVTLVCLFVLALYIKVIYELKRKNN